MLLLSNVINEVFCVEKKNVVTKKVNTDFLEFCDVIVHFSYVCREPSKREGGSENLRQFYMQTWDSLDG